jgi:hypothetical protein
MNDQRVKKLAEDIAVVHSGLLKKENMPDAFMRLVAISMESVECNKDLTGAQKKDAVIQIITIILGMTFLEPNIIASLLQLLPPAIDVICSVANGDFIIQTAKSCCPCLPCFK